MLTCDEEILYPACRFRTSLKLRRHDSESETRMGKRVPEWPCKRSGHFLIDCVCSTIQSGYLCVIWQLNIVAGLPFDMVLRILIDDAMDVGRET